MFWEEQEKTRIEQLQKEREHALETKASLSLMTADLDAFTSTLKKAKKSEYEVSTPVFRNLILMQFYLKIFVIVFAPKYTFITLWFFKENL